MTGFLIGSMDGLGRGVDGSPVRTDFGVKTSFSILLLFVESDFVRSFATRFALARLILELGIAPLEISVEEVKHYSTMRLVRNCLR